MSKPSGWQKDSKRHWEARIFGRASPSDKKSRFWSRFRKPKYPKVAPTKETFSKLSSLDDKKYESLEDMKGIDIQRSKSSPGKFEGNFNSTFARILYEMSIDGGADEEAGDVESAIGWNGLFTGLGEYNIKENGEPVIGAMIYQDSDGFFGYETYSNEKEMRDDWNNIVAEEEKYNEEDNEDY